MPAQQATLESLLTEVARICVLEADLTGIIPAGSFAKLLNGRCCEKYNENTAPIFMNAGGDVQIYKKAGLIGKGIVVLPGEIIVETLELADDYVVKLKTHGFVHDIYPKFNNGCSSKYPERLAQIWNEADWEFLPQMLENTIAYDLSDPFTLKLIKPECTKYKDRIVLLAKD